MDIFASDAARWAFAAWFTFLGGAVGSFLNVVVYRLPAGMSIAWPGSHCPRCKHAIRSFDNVPVLAWLWLGGRCRDCRKPISVRYPLVEAVMAGLFLLLLWVEAFHSAENLPPRVPPADRAAAYTQAQGLAICLLHLGLLSTLIASALITLDGNRPPLRLFGPMLIVGFLSPMICPWLRPQAFAPGMARYAWSGVADSLIGLGVGYYAGRIARWIGRRVAGLGRSGYQIQGEAVMLGVALGWKAILMLLISAMLLEELTRLAALRWRRLDRISAAVWLPPVALFLILDWAWLVSVLHLK